MDPPQTPLFKPKHFYYLNPALRPFFFYFSPASYFILILHFYWYTSCVYLLLVSLFACLPVQLFSCLLHLCTQEARFKRQGETLKKESEMEGRKELITRLILFFLQWKLHRILWNEQNTQQLRSANRPISLNKGLNNSQINLFAF